MRDFLNAILAFIGAESLTDLEFDDIALESTSDPHEVYLTLSQLLLSRESVSDMQDRLNHYYKAKGLDYAQTSTPTTQIFVGGDLCGD